MNCCWGRSGPYLEDNQGTIRQSFFIRYLDPGHHIRLRVQLHHPDQGYALIRDLSDRLMPYLNSGLVTDLQLKTYFRELDRYGYAGMEAVEACFAEDSHYILQLLERGFTDDERYYAAQQLLKYLLDGLACPPDQQLTVVNRFIDAFAKELNLPDKGTKQLNDYHKQFRQATKTFHWPEQLDVSLQELVAVYLELLSDVAAEDQVRLLGDLFHMHINRLFPTDQRVHELVAYYYTMRGIQEAKGRRRIKDGSNVLHEFPISS